MGRSSRSRGSDLQFEELAAKFERRLLSILRMPPSNHRAKRERAIEATWERLVTPLLERP